MSKARIISRQRCPGANRMDHDALIFARMEIARRRGVGIYLSPADLSALHVTHLGEVMGECAEEALAPAPPSTAPDKSGA